VAGALVSDVAPDRLRERLGATIWPLCAGYLGAIAAAEIAGLFSPHLAMVLHVTLLIGLPVQAALAPARDRPLFLALVLVPLVRVVSLGFPLAGQPELFWYLWTSVPLFVAAGAAIHVLGLTREQLGLRAGQIPLQVAIGVAGVPLGALAYFVLQPTAVMSRGSGPELVAATLVLIVCTGFLDELLFRGVLQVPAFNSLGRWGLVYVSAAYTALNIGYGSGMYLLLVFGASLGFAWTVARTRSLMGVSVAHGLASAMCYLLVPALLVEPAAALPSQVPAGVSNMSASPAETRVPPRQASELQVRPLDQSAWVPVAELPDVSGDELATAIEPELAPVADDLPAVEADELAEQTADSPTAPVLETYRVQPGDTLFQVAVARGTTVDALVAANQISNRNHILVGSILLVPVRAE
jgi:uncharacterized protein